MKFNALWGILNMQKKKKVFVDHAFLFFEEKKPRLVKAGYLKYQDNVM